MAGGSPGKPGSLSAAHGIQRGWDPALRAGGREGRGAEPKAKPTGAPSRTAPFVTGLRPRHHVPFGKSEARLGLTKFTAPGPRSGPGTAPAADPGQAGARPRLGGEGVASPVPGCQAAVPRRLPGAAHVRRAGPGRAPSWARRAGLRGPPAPGAPSAPPLSPRPRPQGTPGTPATSGAPKLAAQAAGSGDGAELKCGSCLRPPPTPPLRCLGTGPHRSRDRGGRGRRAAPRSRPGPRTRPGPVVRESRCKERPGPRGSRRGRARADGGPRPPARGRRPGGNALPRPGLTSAATRRGRRRAGGSGFGRGACARPPRTLAPPPLAAGRGRGRGRVRAGPGGRRPAPPRLHGNERASVLESCQGAGRPAPSCLPHRAGLARGQREKPSASGLARAPRRRGPRREGKAAGWAAMGSRAGVREAEVSGIFPTFSH